MKVIDLKDKTKFDIDSLVPPYDSPYVDIDKKVSLILDDIKELGEDKLKFYTEIFDGVNLDSVMVTKDEFEEAYTLIEDDFISIIREAIDNIKEFHINQLPKDWEIARGYDIRLGQLVRPMDRVGVYVPGGKAAYPSTVLMNCIPALIAGVKEIVVATPPLKTGKINPYILVAINELGITEVIKSGGAQSIAAMAYGTENIKPVSKIVGPGNAFVASAKKMVFPKVDIDMIAGPSEVLIIADNTSNPKYIAADIMAQGEHDEMASMYIVTTDSNLPLKIDKEITVQRKQLGRNNILDVSLKNNLYVFIVKDVNDAFKLANEIAPEHLEITLEEPFKYLSLVENAGSIFLGEYTPEALGDYFAGTNHTLPTNRTAKYSSPLGVYDFIKRPSYLYYSKKDLEEVYQKVSKFANYEGLDAHGRSVEVRFEDENGN